ncbi:NAD-dependent epimerase/dehydratase [Lachnellula suecica]|uniref:NAD-dependent epimerase/dehydratase n=1 Tax=Lachnellula suecica TaxID=602035 RepID=A0A8T9C764_9HELO|nr:NAD-dependent epimerase/dehydratase [Lachnellula suecica]
MSNKLVFITGGSGHVGFRTLVTALEAGYDVRAAVRSEFKKDLILSAPSIKALNPKDRLSFVIIPDLSAPGAYDAVLQGATYIIHIASPIVLKGDYDPSEYQSALIGPAVEGTTSILKAAAETDGIKRVVITSSIVAQIDPKYFFEVDRPENEVLDHTSRTSLSAGPYPTDFHAYNASKIAALAATETFVKTHDLSFDVTNIHPSFVTGKNELVTDVSDFTLGTNVTIMGSILGNKSDSPLVGASVHVNDVAYMHVKALSPEIPAGSYVGNSEGEKGTVWQDATRFAAKHFPQAVQAKVVPNDGTQPTRRLRIDVTREERVMGFVFMSFEEQVKSVVEHYLELKGGS